MTFKGFPMPDSKYHKVPNELVDEEMHKMSGSEYMIVSFILRNTWGFQEFDVVKKITIDEIMNGRKKSDGSRLGKGTGLSKPTVIKSLRDAIGHGYIICEDDLSDQSRKKKSYKIKIYDPKNDPESDKDFYHDGKENLPKNNHDGKENLPKNSDFGKKILHRTEKESIERNNATEFSKENSSGLISHEPMGNFVTGLQESGEKKSNDLPDTEIVKILNTIWPRKNSAVTKTRKTKLKNQKMFYNGKEMKKARSPEQMYSEEQLFRDYINWFVNIVKDKWTDPSVDVVVNIICKYDHPEYGWFNYHKKHNQDYTFAQSGLYQPTPDQLVEQRKNSSK